MRFADLYKKNKEDVVRSLSSMWCSIKGSSQQQGYAEQIRDLIEKELFVSEKYMPLVQNMAKYEPVNNEEETEAFNLIDKELWLKTIGGKTYYPPYRHQYKAWKSLTNAGEDEAKHSMVVTTGTGSGKTECFMLPLVDDLIKHPLPDDEHHIEAIFLYPLNALMEDQKSRLQNLLNGSNLKFAVYNGNMPKTGGKDENYPNMVGSRTELHKTPANILLTNPTMLEYMLLRQSDQGLFTQGHLKWIVIDETHTFNGAGAAELAMLIRRLLKAFGVDAKDVRFATSSATIGNAKDEEEQKQNDKKLIEFISGISGVEPSNIDLIKGDIAKVDNSVSEIDYYRRILSKAEYIPLNELIIAGNSIEEKLDLLDGLCDQGLRAKVHFFYRVPNNGLRVQLDDFNDKNNGVLKVKSFVDTTNGVTPFLELKRCEHCGEYFFVAETSSNTPKVYSSCTKAVDNDLLEADSDNQTNIIFFGIDDRSETIHIDGNTLISVSGNTWSSKQSPDQGFNYYVNFHKKCPHCGSELTRKNNAEDGEDNAIEASDVEAITYRISSDFIGRVISEGTLNCLRTSNNGDPHNGQQFISFVDSRQSAAQSTFKQNLDVEKNWAYSRVYHELCRLEKNFESDKANLINEIDRLEEEERYEEAAACKRKLKEYNKRGSSYITWSEIFMLLNEDKDSDLLCKQFLDKKDANEYDEDNDTIDVTVKTKYILSVMLEQFSQYPRTAASPETMGLLSSCYPKLSLIKELPQEVIEFNNKYNVSIDLVNWKNLMKIFLDRTVRSYQSFYLHMKGSQFKSIDIMSCQRFNLSKPPRRPVHGIRVGDKGPYNVVPLMLAKLIDPESDSLLQVVKDNKDSIASVVAAFWKDLKITTELIQNSEYFDSGTGNWKYDESKNEYIEKVRKNFPDVDKYQPRLNVDDIAFELVRHAYLCDAHSQKTDVETLRPVNTLFMGYSPYVIDDSIIEPKGEECWIDKNNHNEGLYPYLYGENFTVDGFKYWASNHRKLLWDNNLWNEEGLFSTRLNKVFSYPDVFIQAEHTAQVDSETAKTSQDLFKKQKLNILACSTTMEMGVDLGNLELVMMSSVPPHPSNYKQRAGRSGRNKDNRSACITLCASDAVGLRSLFDPMKYIIQRPMAVPTVDLQCKNVIQRHVNSFLYRESSVFFDNNTKNNIQQDNNTKNNIHQELIEFFTPYHFGTRTRRDFRGREIKITDYTEVFDANETRIWPKPENSLGDSQGTKYEKFLDFLHDFNDFDSINSLLKNTYYSDNLQLAVDTCIHDWERCRAEVEEYTNDIGSSYEEERNKYNANNPNDQKTGLISTGYANTLMWLYTHTLNREMIKFLSTHRFTPNANMPVDVVEFDVARLKKQDYGSNADNPSYTLVQALNQYVPGNTIIKENRVLQVAGIDFIGKEKKKSPFKTYVSDGNDIVEEPQSSKLKGQNRVTWPINVSQSLTLVEPKSFIPDVNGSESRVYEKNKYSEVQAQLIDAGEWNMSDNTHHLLIARCSRETGNAKILFFNSGDGYGYCLCQRCGKLLKETTPVESNKMKKIPEGMFVSEDKNGSPYHFAIDRIDKSGKPIPCYGPIHRNVIIGNTIQTDYCEIKVRESVNTSWISDPVVYQRLLLSLGVLLTQSLVEYIGKERADVDFLLTRNGHLCIFDTNPGGSGYSSQLEDPYIMNKVINLSYDRLLSINKKEELLDRYTNKYEDLIDLEVTKNWLEAEINSWSILPDTIKNSKYKNATEESLQRIINSFKKKSGIVFVGSDWKKWNLEDNAAGITGYSLTWKNRVQQIIATHLNDKFDICIVSPHQMPLPIYFMLGSMTSWSRVKTIDSNFMDDGFYPLALVDGKLYFTDDESIVNLDSSWSRGNVFSIDFTAAGNIKMKDFDPFKLPNNNFNFEISDPSTERITTKKIVDIVENLSVSNGLKIEDFVDYCKSSSQRLEITVQDEHLKSVLGMIATLQFIEHFVRKTGKCSNFYLTIKNEVYGPCNSSPRIGNNLYDHIERNDYFTDKIRNWLDGSFNISDENTQNEFFKPVVSDTSDALPHWREVKFACGAHSLTFYPDGGIINEWRVDKYRIGTHNYTNDNTTTEDDVPIFRRKAIKYGVKYE